MKTLVITLLLLLTGISAAYADCYYDGKKYKTGERRGSLECQADGTWKRVST